MCEVSQLILNEEMLRMHHFRAFVGAKTKLNITPSIAANYRNRILNITPSREIVLTLQANWDIILLGRVPLVSLKLNYFSCSFLHSGDVIKGSDC